MVTQWQPLQRWCFHGRLLCFTLLKCKDTILKFCASSKRDIFSFGFCFALADFLSFWSERWSQSQDVHKGFVEKHAKSLPFDLCELLHFKVMSMDFLSSKILKPVSLRMYVSWLGSSLYSNTQVLTEAFHKVVTLSKVHPLESKKLDSTLQLFLSLAGVQ